MPYHRFISVLYIYIYIWIYIFLQQLFLHHHIFILTAGKSRVLCRGVDFLYSASALSTLLCNMFRKAHYAGDLNNNFQIILWEWGFFSDQVVQVRKFWGEQQKTILHFFRLTLWNYRILYKQRNLFPLVFIRKRLCSNEKRTSCGQSSIKV